MPVQMVRYSEGDEYEFIVEKEVVTPDNINHYVLSGPDRKKFLLPAEQYSHYGIVTGEKLICRVDKVNCRGEVFLEPVNPFYNEGQCYYFDVKGTDIRTDPFAKTVKVVIVTDHFGNENIVEFRGKIPSPGNSIKLLIERISRGRLILRREFGLRRGTKMVIGEEYQFKVEKLARGLDNCDYFVVMDPYGKRHIISKEHYESYGIKPGSKFKGKVIKFRTNGEIVIEPENPFYSVGSVLEMKVTGISKNEIKNTFNVGLADEFGHSHTVEMSDPPDKDLVKCRVAMIRKGRPRLDVL
jgi:hypothetical protein